MKLYDLTIDASGIRLRYENPSPLSAEQKHEIIITLIVAGAVIGLFALIGSAIAAVAA